MKEKRQRQIRTVTLWGAWINIFLATLKLAVGFWLRSSALVADGVHSISDLATDLVVLVGARASSAPPDESHPYGHSKLETIAGLFVALILLVVSVGLIWSSVMSIYRHQHSFPGYGVLVVAAVSVIAKEVIFHVTLKVSRKASSSVLYANAWHHRSDSLSSLAVLLGGVASVAGWGHADQAAALAVGFMIAGVAVKILYENLMELSEHAIDRLSVRTIERILDNEEEVRQWHALRTRKVGAEHFIDVHILVDPDLTVTKGHEISMRIEERIKESLSRPANILVHVEPDKPEFER